MERQIAQFMIAAPMSGSGKTTVSRMLMAAFTQRGIRVQPYKCGPDYIDTKFHAAVCGRDSVNLDTFMASAPHVKRVYATYAQDAETCIVEGMMGLFDGYHHAQGSSGEIARLLQLPIILVVNARSMAFTLQPLLNGLLRYDRKTHICGIIYNNVGSPRHRKLLQEVTEQLGIKCYGYLPHNNELETASRYLGLDFTEAEASEGCRRLATLAEQHLDVEGLIANMKLPIPEDRALTLKPSKGWNIMVARNKESFSFIYKEHIDLLNRMGNVRYFDPEEKKSIPSDTDLLYLPGGYPEKHARALSQARSCIGSIRRYAEKGGKILAECGGMIYLSEGIETDKGFMPLAGVLPFRITAHKADLRLHLGYRQFQIGKTIIRGHEVHYTNIIGPAKGNFAVKNAQGETVSTQVFRHHNVVASYTHLYLGETNIENLFR